MCAGVAGRAIGGVLERDQACGDRPVGAVCLRDPRRPAGCQDRCRQVAPGRAGKPDGHRGPATRHPRPARPPRTVADPVWVNRRLLLTGAEHLSRRQWKRLGAMLDNCDPTGEIGAAWGVKERLRMLLAEHEPSKIRRRLADFYDAAIDAQLPETSRLAETVQTWWPAILVALTEDASNARTEGFNRIIKQTKRGGCVYRNMINYQRRILSHIAVTRPQI